MRCLDIVRNARIKNRKSRLRKIDDVFFYKSKKFFLWFHSYYEIRETILKPISGFVLRVKFLLRR